MIRVLLDSDQPLPFMLGYPINISEFLIWLPMPKANHEYVDGADMLKWRSLLVVLSPRARENAWDP